MNLKKSILLFFMIAFCSCADTLDFNQFDDFEHRPIISSSLAYTTILSSHFFDDTGTIPIIEITDITEFNAFENDFIKEKLIKLDFNIEIKNEFDNDFLIEIVFLDENDTVTHQFKDLEIFSKDLNFTDKLTIEVSISPNLVNTRKVLSTIKIQNSLTPLNYSDTSEFVFKSSTTIYLNNDI